MNLTPAEVIQLLNYCEDREREGAYSGNKAQFWARHKSIVAKLEAKAKERAKGEGEK